MKASTATPEIESDAQVMAGMGYHAWLFASALGSPRSPLMNTIVNRLVKNDEMQGSRILRSESYL